MQFIFEQHLMGGDRNFGYLIGDRSSGTCVIIDPSYHPQTLTQRAEAQHLKVEWIINTHSHHDHTNGNEEAKSLTHAQTAAYHSSPTNPDLPLKDGTLLTVGSLKLKIYHTPGHCEDHIVIYNPDHRFALTGDLLFVGKIGGTSGEEAALKQWTALERLYDELPIETTIWPGHHYGCRPCSTLEMEKAMNPFLQSKTFDEFMEIKRNWSQLKTENGLI